MKTIKNPTESNAATYSKRELAEQEIVPLVTVEGTKGGSPIAAAVVNAVMYLIDNSR